MLIWMHDMCLEFRHFIIYEHLMDMAGYDRRRMSILLNRDRV